MLKLKEFYQYKRLLKKTSVSIETKKISLDSPLVVKSLDIETCPLLYIKSSYSNTIITLSNLKGKTFFSLSCGATGFVGKKKRSTKFAVEYTLEKAVSKLKELGFTQTFLCLNGFAKARFYIVSSLKKNSIRVVGIRDLTPIAHNGCRPRKIRRG